MRINRTSIDMPNLMKAEIQELLRTYQTSIPT